MKRESIPAVLEIRGNKYVYANLNPYQQVYYRKVNEQVKKVQHIQQLKKSMDNEAYHKTYWKAVGVLDYLLEALENYGKVNHIPRGPL